MKVKGITHACREAWQPSSQSRFVSSSSASLKGSQGSRSPGNLPSPRPSWSFKTHDLAIAKTNATLRKASVTNNDFQRLDVIRPRMEELIKQRNELAMQSNRIADEMATQYTNGSKSKGKEKQSQEGDQDINELRKKGKLIKEQLLPLDKELQSMISESQEIRLRLPNYTNPNSPIGGEEKAIMIGKGGNSSLLQGAMKEAFERANLPIALTDIPELDKGGEPDKGKDHQELASSHGWMDSHTNRIVAGSSWPVLTGSLAALEHALVSYAMQHACQAEYVPVVVPDVVNRDVIERTGFAPRQGGGGQIYWISTDGTSKSKATPEKPDDLALAATAEIPLAGMCAGMIYDADFTSKQYVATSHAFRAEAGARGLDSRGLFRVHQFTKVEMFVVCRVDQSEARLEKLRIIQEEIVAGLGVPYRVLNMPTEELGASAFTKYDIEAWMPGRGMWGEISSASNCTDYQARRLCIRYKADYEKIKKGKGEGLGTGMLWAHTLNGTALAVPRIIVALLENYGVSKEGKMRLPSVLKKHWTYLPSDQVEWVGVQAGHSTRQSAIERVKRMAESRGTDAASMVASFLILHELTAIVPLVLLFYLLGLLGAGDQVMKWLLQVSEDDSSARQWLRGKINEGMQRAERYGRRKGYFGFEEGTSADVQEGGSTATTSMLVGTFANAVAAYAITKALFPLRIGASIALAAPFARLFIEPVKRSIRRRTSKI